MSPTPFYILVVAGGCRLIFAATGAHAATDGAERVAVPPAGKPVVEPLMSQPRETYDRVELFTDDYLIETLSGDARKVLQKPASKEVVFIHDAPWEGNTSGIYYSIFQDGSTYRMYYRGSAVDPVTMKPLRAAVTCLAESIDGIHWTRPSLGLYEWEGSKDNNIVLMDDPGTHNFAVFKDGNPAAPADALYKAVGWENPSRPYKSPDGIHWTRISDTPLLRKGSFDSQNLVFWDKARQEYRFYWRTKPRVQEKTVRSIGTATSKDFISWDNIQDLTYPGNPEPTEWKDAVQLYTNVVQPYFRAPHLFVGFPTQIMGVKTQPLFMASRDGVAFNRWSEPLILTTAPSNRDGNRSNYMAWGMLQLPGNENEISMYASENYYGNTPPRLRRFVYRLDGFVSVSAGAAGGDLVTKPLLFSAKKLVINYKANDDGELRVEIQDAEGKAINGFSLEDCEPLKGDSVKAEVRWKGNPDLNRVHSQKGVRIRYHLRKADLYSMKIEASLEK